MKDKTPIDENMSKFLLDQENFVIDSVEKGEGSRDPLLYNAYLIKKQYEHFHISSNIIQSA